MEKLGNYISGNAVGTGYNGSCGTFANGLIGGLGNTDAFYSNTYGTYEIWIAN